MEPLFDLTGAFNTWGFFLLGAAVLTLVTNSARNYLKNASLPIRTPAKRRDSAVSEGSEDAYYNITPLEDFNVDTEEPIKARPFKPKFHLTMAIENTTFSDLITMDKTYHERIRIRRKLLADEYHEVLGINPKANTAVLEMYKWLTQTYLPGRFPTTFTPISTGLLNKVTNETLPLLPTATHALELMCSHIDDEFLFLLPSSAPEDDSKYRLEAFVTCFPSGFNTRSKLGLLLADIHAPVPSYKQRLERSMDKFFAKLPIGKIVRRWNWTISTTGDLFCIKGNHTTSEELEREGKQDVDLKTTFLRCERQTLHRLPQSKAIVFAFKTYQYPIAELREEGSGEALSEAIEGIGAGSVPEMTVYKRQVVWGNKVQAFLRGEIDVNA